LRFSFWKYTIWQHCFGYHVTSPEGKMKLRIEKQIRIPCDVTGGQNETILSGNTDSDTMWRHRRAKWNSELRNKYFFILCFARTIVQSRNCSCDKTDIYYSFWLP
jgi:hypothetical protein